MTRRQWFLLAILSGLVGAATIAVIYLSGSRKEKSASQDGQPRSEKNEQLVAEARTALAQRDYSRAEVLATRVARSSAASSGAMLIAGEAATKLGRLDDAFDYYAGIPKDESHESFLAQFSMAELQVHQGGLLQAAKTYGRLLQQEYNPELVLHRLALLLNETGRRRDAAPLLFQLLTLDRITDSELILLGSEEILSDGSALPQSAGQMASHDALTNLRQAILSRRNHESREAIRLCRLAINLAPELLEPRVQLGWLLLEGDHTDGFLEWRAALPETMSARPEIRAIDGVWFQVEGDLPRAARCFWDTLQINTDDRLANYRLSQVLVALQREADAKPFAARADRLKQLMDALTLLSVGGSRQDHMRLVRRVVQLMESLGRSWEARAWCRRALQWNPRLEWARKAEQRISARLTVDTPRILPTTGPAGNLDLSDLPLPQWNAKSKSVLPGLVTNDTRALRNAQVSFRNEASSIGISFEYFNGGAANTNTLRMYEFTGGGVAIFDYDGNGWPDIYLTQGCRWPPVPSQTEHLDQIYHNAGNGRCYRVTATAGLGDERFSQGASVGDINQDGFPDLFVANIGGNRLYWNNGDGTFTDVSGLAGIEGEEWTTSGLIADLNGDGLPELYAVNYLTGHDVFQRICRSDSGDTGLCAPKSFSGEQDRAYLNLGDGRFREITDECGITVPQGKGLGLVAADFDNSGRLSLFIANDGVPNFFFRNRTAVRGGDLRFEEKALLSGLACNQDGLTEACMGIAVADADGDKDLELFVTNYYHESNTMYSQSPGHFFRDDTLRSGLHQPGLAVLGFGTQFLDGELDGLPDLIVTNGHVENIDGVPYHMRPQYFGNLGHGRFDEFSADSLGPFFSGRYLGRGLARVDWNRDGREDAVVSHLGAPVALLTNQTTGAGHFLTLRLRGVYSERDAIGATVRLRAGDHTWYQQLTAGDGYQASNERQLVFGLGGAAHVDEVVVTWPSGIRQSFENLSADLQIVVVEGRAEVVFATVD